MMKIKELNKPSILCSCVRKFKISTKVILILENNKVREIILLNFKTYYKATTMKTD